MTLQIHDFLGGKIWLDTDQSGIEAHMATSQWERRKVDLMLRYLKPGMTFADVGAFNGYFSLIATTIEGVTAYAIEPEIHNFISISRNIELNPGCKLTVYQLAFSNTVNALVNVYRGPHAGMHSLAPVRSEIVEHQVMAVTFDWFFEQETVDVVKIDVEAWDYQVVEGMERHLRTQQQMVILMDLHPELGCNSNNVSVLLTQHGFKLYDIRNECQPIEFIYDSMVELLALKGYE